MPTLRPPLLALLALTGACAPAAQHEPASLPTPTVATAAACARASPVRPPVFDRLTTASELFLHDVRNGHGLSYAAVLRLSRTGDEFDVHARLATGGALGEVERTDLGTRGCACAVEAPCPCDRADRGQVVFKETKVPRDVVDRYLRVLAEHGLDLDIAPRSYPARYWTDDEPEAAVIVRLPGRVEGSHAPWSFDYRSRSTPEAGERVSLQFSFRNQQRRWQYEGIPLSPDPPEDGGSFVGGLAHPTIYRAYEAMLHGIGLREWVKELYHTTPPESPGKAWGDDTRLPRSSE